MSASAEEHSDDEDGVLDILLGSLPLWCEFFDATELRNVQLVCRDWHGVVQLEMRGDDDDDEDGEHDEDSMIDGAGAIYADNAHDGGAGAGATGADATGAGAAAEMDPGQDVPNDDGKDVAEPVPISASAAVQRELDDLRAKYAALQQRQLPAALPSAGLREAASEHDIGAMVRDSTGAGAEPGFGYISIPETAAATRPNTNTTPTTIMKQVKSFISHVVGLMSP